MMRRLACVAIALLLIESSGLAQQQPVRDRAGAVAAAPAGTASISGRVQIMIDGKPTPVRRARITLTSDKSAGRVINADTNGVYRFADLPAGTYRVLAEKAGFVPLLADPRRAYDRPAPFEVKDAQPVTHDLWMQRGAALEGQLTLADGTPMSDVVISALRVGYDTNGKRYVSVRQARTDDRGHYRVHTLPPGQYAVEASLDPLSAARPVGSTTDRPQTIARTYFPGTAQLDEVRMVPVAVGETKTDLDFAATTMPIVNVGGRIIDSVGRPVTQFAIRLSLVNGMPSDVRGFRLPESNEFHFDFVPPGEYWIAVATMPAAGAEPEFAAMRATIDRQNLQNVSIATEPGATIAGAVVTDTGAPVPPLLKAQAFEAVFHVPRSGATNVESADVAADGQFAMTRLFGPRVFRLAEPSGQWAVKNVTLNGADITDAPFHFKKASDPLNLRIVVTSNTATIAGVTADTAGKPIPARVVVFEAEESRWGFASRFVRSMETGSDGRYHVDGLLPGNYRIAAVTYLEEGAWYDADVLRQLAAQSTPLTVTGRQSQTLNLTAR